MLGRLARVATMSDPIRVDPSSAPAALCNRPHDDNLGPLQVVAGCPRGLEAQGNEPVGSALGAWPHGRLMVPRLPIESRPITLTD
ncbi:MAG: hypothetical protein QOE18_1385 [Chloroflexota bacterium]|jgi:hypothetical protein|nr:hypothetical protein [Chloroflexota bacterium]